MKKERASAVRFRKKKPKMRWKPRGGREKGSEREEGGKGVGMVFIKLVKKSQENRREEKQQAPGMSRGRKGRMKLPRSD